VGTPTGLARQCEHESRQETVSCTSSELRVARRLLALYVTITSLVLLKLRLPQPSRETGRTEKIEGSGCLQVAS